MIEKELWGIFMIKSKKSGTALFIVLMMILACFLTACESTDDSDTDINEVEYVDTSVKSSAQKTGSDLRTIKTAIIQYDTSEILNESCTAVKEVFDNNNVTYDLYVGNDEDPLGDCIEYANNIVINGGYDSVITIGSKAADDVYSAIRTASKIPVVFCAPDEPIMKSFADRVNSASDKCYGIAITQNLAQAQFDMINTFQPEITSLGVIYLANDTRSQTYLSTLEKKCKDNGVYLEKQRASDINEFIYMIENVSDQVQAITLLPENTLGTDLDRISQKAISENIPLYGVADLDYAGKFPASVCYDYKKIGEDSANLMINLMFGGDMSDTQNIRIAYSNVYGNKQLLDKFDIEIPENYKDRFVDVN